MDKSIDETLVQVSDALMGDGKDIDIGCPPESIDNIIKQVIQINSNKKFRVVTNWQWWDIQFPSHDKVIEQLENMGKLPSLIYSSNLLIDSSGEFSPGFSLRSTYLIKLSNECIFETGNTFYILVGKGTRKSVNAKLAFSIFF